MSGRLPITYVARHGETAWTITGQHTGLTDLPLTERGERNARRLGERLKGLTFAKVFTSPLQRASRIAPINAQVDRSPCYRTCPATLSPSVITVPELPGASETMRIRNDADKAAAKKIGAEGWPGGLRTGPD